MSFGQAARLGFTAVGAYFGGPMGAMIGSAIGGALFPEQLPDINGQKLGDMQMTNSAYGAPIPLVYGTTRIATTILWTSGRKAKKVSETEGGKGGPEQTTNYYTYSLDAAFAICEGPIVGVKRIWINSRLMFDSGSPETQLTVGEGGGSLANGVTVYTGEEDQQPSSLHESYEGVGMVPAYRGLAYIEFDNLQLAEFGNGMVNVEVEVTAAGAVSPPINSLHALETDIGNRQGGLLDEGTILHSTDTILTNLTGYITVYRRDLYGNAIQEKRLDYDLSSMGLGGTANTGKCKNDPYFLWWGGDSPGTKYGALMWFKALDINGTFIRDTLSNTWLGTLDPTSSNVWWSTSDHTIRLGDQAYATIAQNSLYSWLRIFAISTLDFGPTNTLVYETKLNVDPDFTGTGNQFGIYPDQSGRDYFFITHPNGAGDHKDYVTMMDFDYNVVAQWKDSLCPEIASALNHFFSSDGYCVSIPSGTNHTANFYTFDAFTTNSVWTLTDSLALNATGTVGLSNSIMPLGSKWFAFTDELLSIDDVVTIGPETVASIVEDQCARVGIASTQVDTTGLTKSVAGYFLSQNMSGRNALETLQVVGFFDVAEVDGKIVCTERGGATQGIIPQDDLAAVVGSGHAEDMEIVRRGELELPRKVSVTYMNPDDDYLTNTQTAERLTTLGEGVQNAQVPIVLDDADAMTLTDAMLYQHYSERETVTFFLSTKHMKIAPNDVWTVGDSAYRIRIETVTQDIVGVLTIKGIIELTSETYTIVRDTAFVSSATPVVGLTGPTLFAFMNLPMLRVLDDRSGVYIAGAGVYDGWAGFDLFVSDDNATYNAVETVVTGAGFGTTTEALASAERTTTWDWSTTLNVRPVNGTVLASDTEANVINGANVAAVGIDSGLWEIIQWVTASAEADGTYTLSQLLRGRNGTEYATDQHSTSEDFVVLAEDGSVIFTATDSAQIDTARYYKSVTHGTQIQATDYDYLTDTGGPLTPRSPAHLRGERIGSGSATVSFTWKRRSRYPYDSYWNNIVGEDSTLFEVDFYDEASVLLRTVSTAKSSVAYSSADRVSDGASANETITTNVFQISGTVGRGHPATAAI